MFYKYSKPSRSVPIRSVYRQATSYGGSFHWLEAGWDHDETVVLLHGLMAHGMAYRKIIAHLSQSYRVVIPDLPAHGRDQTFRSTRLPPQIDRLVGWLDEVLQVIAAPRFHLVGHSLGALVAFMAARQPDILSRAASMTLVSPGLRIKVPRWSSRLFELMPFGLAQLGATPMGVRAYEPIQWRKSRMSSSEIDLYVEPFRQPRRLKFMIDLGIDLVRQPDRIDQARHIDHRTLVVLGDRDHLVPLETGHLLQEMIDGAHFEVLEGVGHCPMEDCPGEFSRILERFWS